MPGDRIYDFEKFFNLSIDLFAIAGIDGNFKLVNPSFSRLLGWDRSELLEQPFTHFIHPEDLVVATKEMERLKSGQPVLSFENRFRRKDGTYRSLLWNAFPDKEYGLFYAVARDITELKQSQEKFKYIIESSPGAMILVDRGGNISVVNNEAMRLFGYSQEEMIGQRISFLIPSAVRERHDALCSGYFQKPEVKAMGQGRDLIGLHRDGTPFPVEVGLNPVEVGREQYVICAIVDISFRKKAEEAYLKQVRNLNEQASVDALTGINNRRIFDEELQKHLSLASRNRQPLSLIILDVDKFKSYNDTYGHQAGDQVLKKVAQTLKRESRITDVVTRYGGEEFAIILPGTGEETSRMAAERLRQALERETWEQRQITASFGITTKYFADTTRINIDAGAESMIREADSALYYSKETGRNRISHFGDLPSEWKAP